MESTKLPLPIKYNLQYWRIEIKYWYQPRLIDQFLDLITRNWLTLVWTDQHQQWLAKFWIILLNFDSPKKGRYVRRSRNMLMVAIVGNHRRGSRRRGKQRKKYEKKIETIITENRSHWCYCSYKTIAYAVNYFCCNVCPHWHAR